MRTRRTIRVMSALIALLMIVMTVPLGSVPAAAEEHTHDYGACVRYNDTLHMRVCECGMTEYTHHNWDAGTNGLVPEEGSGESSNWGDITFNPTPDFSGVTGSVTYTCLDCGATYVGNVGSLPEHTYSEYVKLNATQHKHACLCGEYVAENHTWDSGKVTVAATHTTTGTKVYTCTLCGETKTETIPTSAAHEWDNGVITKQPTCTEAGVKTYTCGCGETKTETVAATGHSYGDWTKHDGTNHKKTCTVCGTVAYEAHAWNDGVVQKQPTHLETGIKLYTCSACGETKTETLPTVATHEWDNGVITKQPTCTEAGVKTYTCGCGETKTETVAATGHSYGDWTKHDETNHKKTCTVCGTVAYEAHAWDGGVVQNAPTHSETGLKVYTCTVCGETETETLPTVAHEYGAWSKYSNLLHSHSCECGVTEYAHHNWEETTKLGLYLAGENGAGTGYVMSWEELFAGSGNLNDTCYVCSDCGFFYDGNLNSLPEHSYDTYENLNETEHKLTCKCGEGIVEAHVWGDGVVTTEPTCEGTGVKTYTCVCGETKTETLAAVGHSFGDWEEHDKEQHVHSCACGKSEYEEHAWDAGVTVGNVITYTCSACGATKSETLIIPGDINGDGTVNATDVAILRRHLADWEGYKVINEEAADVNNDGLINATDVALIRRYLAGWDGIVLK